MKPTWRPMALAPFLSLLLVQVAAAQGSTRHDTQLWNDVQVLFRLNERVDFVLFGTLRFGRNISRPVDERSGVGFNFKVSKHLTLSPSYLYFATQPLPNQKGFENRLSLAATPRFVISGFTISDRNLIERRMRHPQTDSTRYRNRLQVEHPLPKGMKWNLFASDEIFYDWMFEAWVRNRFAIGASRAFNNHLTLEVYYLRQNDSHARPGDVHALGSTWKIRL